MTEPQCATCAVALSQHPAGECLNAWAAQARAHSLETPNWMPWMLDYSQNIRSAWELVEALRQDGWIVRVQEMPDNLPFILGSGWHGENEQDHGLHRRACCILHSNRILEEKREIGIRGGYTSFGNTAPLAICRAFLMAKSEESE